MKVKMKFPQIVWEEKEIELNANDQFEFWEGNLAKLIWSKLTDHEKEQTFGFKMVDDLTEIDMEHLVLTPEQHEEIENKFLTSREGN